MEKVGCYNIIKSLGGGASGLVYLAQNTITGDYVAIKRVTKGTQQNEIQLHSLVSDNNYVLTLYEVIHDNEFDYLILEYCPDGDLFEHIVSQSESNRIQHEEIHRRLILQIIKGIQACQSAGVYHRDIKPENILLKNHNIRIGDFGLATTKPTSLDTGCGSTCYLSPESISSLTPFATGPSDVWSLGILMVNLMCGLNPWKIAHFQDGSYKSYLQDNFYLYRHLGISYDFYLILARALHPDPDLRSTLHELEEDVLRCPYFLANSLQTPSLSEDLSESSFQLIECSISSKSDCVNDSLASSQLDFDLDPHYNSDDPYSDPHSKYAMYFNTTSILADGLDLDLDFD